MSAAAALACAIGTPPAAGAQAETVAFAKLRGVSVAPDASGYASFQLYPRHAEIDFTQLRNLPPDRRVAYIVWLIRDTSQAYVGGAFPRGAAKTPGTLSPIAPGGDIGRRNVREADRIVVTMNRYRRAGHFLREQRQAGWDSPAHIHGKRVLRGKLFMPERRR